MARTFGSKAKIRHSGERILSADELKRTITVYLNMPVSKLLKIRLKKNLKALDQIIINAVVEACQESSKYGGSIRKAEFLFLRCLGKPQEQEIALVPVSPLREEMQRKTTQELLAILAKTKGVAA